MHMHGYKLIKSSVLRCGHHKTSFLHDAKIVVFFLFSKFIVFLIWLLLSVKWYHLILAQYTSWHSQYVYWNYTSIADKQYNWTSYLIDIYVWRIFVYGGSPFWWHQNLPLWLLEVQMTELIHRQGTRCIMDTCQHMFGIKISLHRSTTKSTQN